MGVVNTRLIGLVLGAVGWQLASAQMPDALAPAAASADEAARAERWQQLRHAIFADRPIDDGSALIAIDAPARALDAALVPVDLKLTSPAAVKGVYLIIDNNPAPLAGHFVFGPAGDAHLLKLRVRVNAYTYLHAVVETNDAHLYAAERFVKAAGGCSAPAGGDDEHALQDLGHIKLRLQTPFVAGKSVQAQIMIRHPNFNGMQMNQLTRLYTPALFIRTIDVTYDGAAVMHVDSDISLSSDPVISFGFVARQPGELNVAVHDTKEGVFTQRFAVPPEAAPVSPAG